jgi:hypothetical protein
MVRFDSSLYSVTLVQRDNPRPWSWAILKTGLKNPIQRSIRSFATEAEARMDGETALGSLVEVLQSRRSSKSRSSPVDQTNSNG